MSFAHTRDWKAYRRGIRRAEKIRRQSFGWDNPVPRAQRRVMQEASK